MQADPEELAKEFYEKFGEIARERNINTVSWDSVGEKIQQITIDAFKEMGPLFTSVVHVCCSMPGNPPEQD